jgi:hypothetical protein
MIPLRMAFVSLKRGHAFLKRKRVANVTGNPGRSSGIAQPAIQPPDDSPVVRDRATQVANRKLMPCQLLPTGNSLPYGSRPTLTVVPLGTPDNSPLL